MNTKSFFALLLAVHLFLSGIVFSTPNIDEGDSPWSLLPDARIFSFFQSEEASLDEYADVIGRFHDMNIYLKDSKTDVTTYKKAKEETLQMLSREIENLNASIERATQEISVFDASVTSLENEISDLSHKQEQLGGLIKKLALRAYSDSLESDTDVTLVGLLMNASLGDTMRESQTQSIMEATTLSLATQQQKQQEKITSIQSSLRDKKDARQRTLVRLDSMKSEREEAQKLEAELLGKARVRERSIQNDISRNTIKTSQIQQKFEQAFVDYESRISEYSKQFGCPNAKEPLCTWIAQYTKAEKQLRSNTGTSKVDVWPLSPVQQGFGYHFRDQQYHYTHNIHHNGVDIRGKTGDDISAINDGYILAVRAESDTHPGIVIVKHKRGRISIYRNITSVTKKAFETVMRGEIIGKLGNTIEHTDTNNLHLEEYKNGDFVDPLEVFSLAGVPTKYIPKRYGWKYIDDRKKIGKSVDIEKFQKEIGFFFVPGDDELARQENFLQTYASTSYSDAALWREESLAEGIDPSFVMCVGFAESTLGQNLTTDGNIGNVGNTDSGDRRSFSGPRAGVRAIANTVNNQYLGGYSTIDQLSGWGNDYGPIYASSPTNWHENILKCMSALKAGYVGNEASFRMTQAQLLKYQKAGYALGESVSQVVLN